MLLKIVSNAYMISPFIPSFTDLSKSIAASWRAIDGETKLFCAQVSDIGMQHYKREMQRFKASKKQNEPDSSDSESSQTQKKKPPTTSISSHNIESVARAQVYNNMTPVEKATTGGNFDKVSMQSSQPSTISNDLFLKPFATAHYLPETTTSSNTWGSTAAAQFNRSATCGICTNDTKHESTSSGESTSLKTDRRERAGRSSVDLPDDDILNMWKSAWKVLGTVVFSMFV